MIFVFGSNLAGIHGAGAAKEAFNNFEAISGVGVGPTGRAYAIPTKDKNITTLSLHEIQKHVADFLQYARECSGDEFFVTAIGCGLAGYTPFDIAPMFKNAPQNCTLHRRLVEVMDG